MEAQGIAFEGVDAALQVPESDLRLFGKPESFTKRRMGVAVANGADAVYLGASKFNARDEGAQLSLDDLEIDVELPATTEGAPAPIQLAVAVGAGKQVVAVDDQSNYPARAPRTKLSGFTPSSS